ncbi:MAG: hypothetical protein HY673_09800 [Chloroflexi bacterium]|nr:hypothetical protein [Chloroflexota bacterium]
MATTTLSVIVKSANPVFIVLALGLPVGGLVYADISGSITILNYVHVMTGGLWTGIDLFYGFVMGPVLGGMDPGQRAAVFKRLVPRMTFLMPSLAGVAITSGIQLAQKMGMANLTDPWIAAAAIIAALLTIQGFGVLLPNEVRVFAQLLRPAPDINEISRLGMRNARLGGVQGLFQLAIMFVMANLRF